MIGLIPVDEQHTDTGAGRAGWRTRRIVPVAGGIVEPAAATPAHRRRRDRARVPTRGHTRPRAGSYDGAMAYDEELADRIRAGLAGRSDVTEKKMFGGLAFLVGGNMAVAASGQGGLMVRVDPAESERLVATTAARPMEMRGREMAGWLRLASHDVRTKRQLDRWLRLGAAYAGSLPAKPRQASR
jgi:TfoX/Sxy family transcriptional regulator of competence genes